MMLADVTANGLTAFGTIAAVCLVAGGGIGRKWGITKKHRAEEEKSSATRDTILQELTWSVAGKAPDQWNPKGSPGLAAQMITFQGALSILENNTTEMFRKLLERAEKSEDQTAAAAALAANAVLATASKVATDKNEAAATASAEVLATAVATAVALALNPPRPVTTLQPENSSPSSKL